MVARLPHPNTVPSTIPNTSPMEHPVRQCSVAEKAVRLSGLFNVAMRVLPVRVIAAIIYPRGVYVKKTVATAMVRVPLV
jgi:hypothetical protein